MHYHPFIMGATILAYQKTDKKYGMCCSWVQMIDYDKIAMLIGATSVSGQNLKVGQIVGISSLSSFQSELALHFGNNHSDEVDKFNSIFISQEEEAIYMMDAKVRMKCIVKDILALPRMEEDFFVIMDILSYHEDKDKIFLDARDII